MSGSNVETQTEFFVSRGEEQLGPWTIEEVAERLAKAEISVTDFIFDDTHQDWIPLLECAALKAVLHKAKPKARPAPKAAPSTTAAATSTQARHETSQVETGSAETAPTLAKSNDETFKAPSAQVPTGGTPVSQPSAKAGDEQWFVQKGAHRYGPFTYMGLVRALQEKTIYEFDFLWKNGMETWIRIAEHELFTPEKIREISKTAAAKGEVLIERKHPRISFESEVIVHDETSVWMGRTFEASIGGSGLEIENATLLPGQVIRLHFASTDSLPAFNALGEIVGKRFSKDIRDTNSPVKYTVRFLKIDGAAETCVREYFSSARG